MPKQFRKSGAPKVVEQRWMLFTDRSVHGIKHSELTVLRQVPRQQTVRSTLSVFSISKAFAVAGLVLLVLLLVLVGCSLPPAQKGGHSTTQITRPWQTNAVSFSQSDNPNTPSHQTMQSEQTVEYLVPGAGLRDYGTAGLRGHGLRDHGLQDHGLQDYGTAGLRDHGLQDYGTRRLQEGAGSIVPHGAMPVRITSKDSTDTTIGAAQKDTVREWAGKARNLQPVMWAGIVMMSVVAGILIYFGWWTKGAIAVAVGVAMIVLAQALPNHEALILLGGLGVFGLAAMLVLYSYYKGQLDKNHNGIPELLERHPQPNQG